MHMIVFIIIINYMFIHVHNKYCCFHYFDENNIIIIMYMHKQINELQSYEGVASPLAASMFAGICGLSSSFSYSTWNSFVVFLHMLTSK